jgi:DNA modification methylase
MDLIYSAIKNDFSSSLPDDSWSFREAKRSETNYISHCYHRYPAKFIPQIVNKLIRDFTDKGDLVLDPFGGCGTTLVEAKVLGRKSIGFDINPVAKLIAETKVTPLSPISLENYLKDFIDDYRQLENKEISLDHSERTRYWFDPVMMNQLDRVYQSINQIKNFQVRRFYLCAFSHILKNCSRWLMKSIKPQIDPDKIPPDVFKTFLGHMHLMMTKNKEFYELLKKSENIKTGANMRLRDSTKRFPLKDCSVDLIITSPPYVTSYEYADLHQLILLWLGDDPQRYSRWNKYVRQYRSFKEKFVGTKLAENNNESRFLGFFAHQIINQLPNNQKYARSVAKYFSDMQKTIAEMYRVLEPGKKACIIIGNTTLAGIEVKNAEVAAEQMQEAGFVMNRVIKRELSNKMITPWRDKINGRFTSTTSPQKTRVYEHEFILIAEKPSYLSN